MTVEPTLPDDTSEDDLLLVFAGSAAPLPASANPFMMMLRPDVVQAAVERSEKLGRLNRRLCHPLDRPGAYRQAAVTDQIDETTLTDARQLAELKGLGKVQLELLDSIWNPLPEGQRRGITLYGAIYKGKGVPADYLQKFMDFAGQLPDYNAPLTLEDVTLGDRLELPPDAAHQIILMSAMEAYRTYAGAGFDQRTAALVQLRLVQLDGARGGNLMPARSQPNYKISRPAVAAVLKEHGFFNRAGITPDPAP